MNNNKTQQKMPMNTKGQKGTWGVDAQGNASRNCWQAPIEFSKEVLMNTNKTQYKSTNEHQQNIARRHWQAPTKHMKEAPMNNNRA
jgi:hypothetical protein